MRSGYVSAAEVEARFARDISQLVDISPNLIIDDTAQGPGGVGAHLLWTPRVDLDLEYSYTREEYDQDTPALLNMSQPGQLFCDAFGFCAPDEDTPVSGDRFDLLQGEVLQDWDGVPLTLFETTRPEVYDQTSHELRLTLAGDRLNYVVGAYLFDMEYTIDLVSFIGFAVPNLRNPGHL